MSKLNNVGVLLAEKEVNYGVDPTPSYSTDAFLVSNFNIELLGEQKETNYVMASMGKSQPFNLGDGVKVSFDIEFKGALTGTITPPRISRFLEAFNLTETIDSGVSATYAPNSSIDGTSLTIHGNKDGILHKVSGCRGESMKFNGKANEIASLSLSYIGLYVNPSTFASDAALSTPTYVSETTQIFKSANATINSYSAIIENITFELNNTLSKRTNANAVTGVEAYSITDREVVGSMDPEAKALSTYNPWTPWAASMAITVVFKIGSYITITMNRCIKQIPKYGSRNSMLVYAEAYRAHPSVDVGNDEFNIVFTKQS